MTLNELLRLELFIALPVVGLVVGSFLNVCIYRIPRGKSVVRPRSRCPQCGHPIRAWHNVPVVSWLWLRGRCADCAAPIPPRYPAVEALNAMLWLVAGLRYGATAQTLVLLPFLSAMVVLFFTDWDHQILPDRVTFPLFGAGLALAPWNGLVRLDTDLARGMHGFLAWLIAAGQRAQPGPGASWLEVALGKGAALSAPLLGGVRSLCGAYLVGTAGDGPGARLLAALVAAAAGFLAYYALRVVGGLVFRREALGLGDVKLMLGFGAFLGVTGVLLSTLLASFAAVLLHLPLRLSGRRDAGAEIPLGCYLCPAAVLVAFHGADLLRWYVSRVLLRA